MTVMDNRRKTFVHTGGLFGLLYLITNRTNGILPDMPALELAKGLLMGLGLAFLVVSLLPEEAMAKLRGWKSRG